MNITRGVGGSLPNGGRQTGITLPAELCPVHTRRTSCSLSTDNSLPDPMPMVSLCVEATGEVIVYYGATIKPSSGNGWTFKGGVNFSPMIGDSIEPEPRYHPKKSAHTPHSKEPSWAKGEDYHEEFQAARDHFGKSGTAADKAKMDEKAKEHVKAFIDSVQDIWADADPQMRKQLKSNLTRMVNDLT